MKILVTGGAGYVGSVIVHKLVSHNYNPIVVDDLSSGHTNMLPEGIKLYVGNIGDENFLSEIFSLNKITHVIHCAAFIDVNESVVNPIKYFDNNVGNAIKLLKIMELHNCSNIIFSSTCATFGIPDSLPIKETNIQRPINTYGQTKLMFEQILKKMSDVHKFNCVVLRYFNVCGSYIDGDLIIGEDHNPETHLIPLAIKALIEQTEFTVFGTDYETTDGTCIRDYIHIEDLVDAHILALGLQNGSGQITGSFRDYNLGSEKGFSVREIINTIEDVTGQKLNLVYGNRRQGDPSVLYADSTKIRNELGWIPKYSIIDIIQSAYIWHLE